MELKDIIKGVLGLIGSFVAWRLLEYSENSIWKGIQKRKIRFEAGILDKKESELGETVFFRVRFRGKLKNGFFDSDIVHPDGSHTWS